MNEVFNLERQTALENSIDPTGRKWIVKGNRESALVHARPEPDRTDAQIPKYFQGQWTSPTILREKIEHWLNQQWDISDRAKDLAAGKTRAAAERAVEAAAKVTPEESIAALPDEIKQELGITDDDTKEKEATGKESKAVSKVVADKVSKPQSKKVRRKTKG